MYPPEAFPAIIALPTEMGLLNTQVNLARTPDMAGISPLNNFLGPESDPVTVATQLPKYQRSIASPNLIPGPTSIVLILILITHL